MEDMVIGVFNDNLNFVWSLIIIFSTLILIFLVHQLRNNVYKVMKKKSKGFKRILALEHPLLLIIVILGLQALLSTYIKDYPTIHSTLTNILITLAIIVSTYILGVISAVSLENWSRNLKKTRNDETHEGIVPLMKSVVNILLGLLALIFVLQAWNISVGALLTSLGIAGVIIGFAFRDSLTNVFGGISLILDDNFRKGDLIELEDGEIGFVLETSLRSTKLKNFDSEEIYVPNALLANKIVKNYAQPTNSIRLKIRMPVAIGTDIKKAEEVILKMLDRRDDILDYPVPKVYFLEVKDHYISLAVCFFISDFHDLFVKKSDVSKELYVTLQKHKIKIPVPIRELYNKK